MQNFWLENEILILSLYRNLCERQYLILFYDSTNFQIYRNPNSIFLGAHTQILFWSLLTFKYIICIKYKHFPIINLNFILLEGELCFHQKKGVNGVCKILSNCPAAITDIRQGIYPQNCGFQGTVVVVCCPQTSTPKPVGEKCKEGNTFIKKILKVVKKLFL